MFYIDAASYLDSDDPNWHYFLMFERYDHHDASHFYSSMGRKTK